MWTKDLGQVKKQKEESDTKMQLTQAESPERGMGQRENA